MFTIDWLPVISSVASEPPVFLRSVKCVEGVTFFKLIKSDNVMERLLCGKSPSRSERLLPKTRIIETIASLRNQAIQHLIQPPAHDDLGLDAEEPIRKRKAAIDLSQLPEALTITLPDIQDIPGCAAKVLVDKPASPLWLEFSPQILEYVAKVCRYQIEHDPTVKDKHRHSEIANTERGISWDASRQKYRCKRGDGKQKYFNTPELCLEWIDGLIDDSTDGNGPNGSEALPIQGQ